MPFGPNEDRRIFDIDVAARMLDLLQHRQWRVSMISWDAQVLSIVIVTNLSLVLP